MIRPSRLLISYVIKPRSTRVYLEQYRKIVKARKRRELTTGTEGARDDHAYTSSDYLEVLNGLRDAVKQETYLQWRIEAARVKISAWQTERKANLV